MAEIYRNRMYHMGITIGLSTVKEQKPYSTKAENIHKLEDSDFYYAIEEKGSRVINEIVNSIHRHQENKIDIILSLKKKYQKMLLYSYIKIIIYNWNYINL